MEPLKPDCARIQQLSRHQMDTNFHHWIFSLHDTGTTFRQGSLDIIDEMINQLRKSPSAETDTFRTLIETVQALADEVRDLKRKIGTK
jgi:hypothetical protein